MPVLTQEQRLALKKVYERGFDGTYLQFRRTAVCAVFTDCVLIPFCGMLLGIEPDGHTHS